MQNKHLCITVSCFMEIRLKVLRSIPRNTAILTRKAGLDGSPSPYLSRSVSACALPRCYEFSLIILFDWLH